MLLCDIGNTSYHFYDLKYHYKKNVLDFDPSNITQKVYYICVHHLTCKKLNTLSNWIDLENYIDRKKYYKNMGIDRIIACEAIQNGVIIDAGSAITVDVVKDGVFQGGFIIPGKQAYENTLNAISPALKTKLNFQIDFKNLPKNTNDALSYGFFSGLKKEVESYNLDIILTGGDAQNMQEIFPTAQKDEMLLFKGMEKILQKKDSL